MNWFLSSAVGLLSGVMASMGLGGGFILLVYLALYTDMEQQAAQGVNLFFFIPIIALSLVFHIKNRLVDLKTALFCGGAGAAVAAAGYAVAEALEGDLLRKIFAVFIIAAGLRDLFSKSVDKRAQRK